MEMWVEEYDRILVDHHDIIEDYKRKIDELTRCDEDEDEVTIATRCLCVVIDFLQVMREITSCEEILRQIVYVNLINIASNNDCMYDGEIWCEFFPGLSGLIES
jgi:hypothetical protein